MEKVDLDELEKQFKDMQIPNLNFIRYILPMARELRAAREIVSYHRASLCAVARSYLSCTCYGCALLRKYDEVTKDGEG